MPSCWSDITSDLDTYRTACILIREHGDKAEIHAAMRAGEMLEAGDLGGAATWRRVIKTIEELKREDASLR